MCIFIDTTPVLPLAMENFIKVFRDENLLSESFMESFTQNFAILQTTFRCFSSVISTWPIKSTYL